MLPINFKQCNGAFNSDVDIDIPAYRGPNIHDKECIVICYQLNKEELDTIAETCKIWVMTDVTKLVTEIAIESPFNTKTNDNG